MKNLLKMSDLSPAELTHILDVADQLKADCKAGRTAPLLAGKSVALLFSKASTRTRTSFEVGVYQMGGLGNYMNTAELQAGRGEPLRDTARVLGRYYDCAVWRTYRQRDLEELAELSGIPVINGLTDYAHPCQVLADLMTIRERRGTLAGLKLCFVGDGSNMANSLIVGGLLAGMQVSCVCPPGYRPAADVLIFAHKYGNAFHLTTDPAEGVRDADIVATAAWNTTAPRHRRERAASAGFCGLPAHRPSAGKTPSRTRWCCTVCPPTGARRSPPPCSSSTRTRSLTRQRTVSTSRKPCWRCCWRASKTLLNARRYRVAAPSIRIVPWAALASCWPLPQQLLPVSAAGGGRRRCTLGINSGKSIFYLQFRNACGRFGTAFLWEKSIPPPYRDFAHNFAPFFGRCCPQKRFISLNFGAILNLAFLSVPAVPFGGIAGQINRQRRGYHEKNAS